MGVIIFLGIRDPPVIVAVWSGLLDTALANFMLTGEQLDIAAEALIVLLNEAKATYFYDEVTVKRWVLGPGGVSGNCEICNDNADAGWIDMDGIFEGVEEDIDEPPAHPNCECEVEYKDARRRVYV